METRTEADKTNMAISIFPSPILAVILHPLLDIHNDDLHHLEDNWNVVSRLTRLVEEPM